MSERRSTPWATMGRGGVMGIADVIPGVSGGTMALLLGVYDRFIAALAHLDVRHLRLAFGLHTRDGRRRFIAHARETDLLFLIQLAIGLGIAIIIGARVLGRLIDGYPIIMMALFFGLILVSVRLPFRTIQRPRLILGVPVLIGALLAAGLTLLPAQTTDPGALMLVASGALAVSAMLLPGISGSALLVLLGVYPAVLAAVEEWQLVQLALFATGGLIGILLSSRLIQTALARRPDITHATLTGLMIGSLVRVWPWRDADGFGAGHATIPDTFLPWVLILVGALVSVLLEWIAPRPSQSAEGHARNTAE